MHYKLGFARTFDGHLIVLTDLRNEVTGLGEISATHFPNENIFYASVVEARLGEEEITSIFAAAFLALSEDPPPAEWVSVTSTREQLQILGLHLDLNFTGRSSESGLAPNSNDLSPALTASPSPIVVLRGPQHVFTFINPAYVRLMGRKSAESVLGKPVREALPELQGQPFFSLLDQVYRTGEPFIGQEIPAKLQNEETGEFADFHFDFVYYPVRNSSGEVDTILCQANDVSDRVLARQVSEARETKLYEQWAELEAIYNNAPFAMALVAVSDYRILRINRVCAALLDRSPRELVGQRIFDILPGLHQLKAIYERVERGEEVRNVRFEITPADAGRPTQQLVTNFNAVLNVRGEITAIASIALDCAEPMKFSEHVVIDLASQATSISSSK